MSDVPMKHFWRGEDIDTLPREKLIEIIVELGKQIEALRGSLASSARLSADLMRLAAKRATT